MYQRPPAAVKHKKIDSFIFRDKQIFCFISNIFCLDASLISEIVPEHDHPGGKIIRMNEHSFAVKFDRITLPDPDGAPRNALVHAIAFADGGHSFTTTGVYGIIGRSG